MIKDKSQLKWTKQRKKINICLKKDCSFNWCKFDIKVHYLKINSKKLIVKIIVKNYKKIRIMILYDNRVFCFDERLDITIF